VTDSIPEDVFDQADALLDEDQAERCVFTIKRDLRRRLDVYLHSRLKGISRNKVQQLIELRGVKVNGRDPKPSTTIRLGDVVEVILPTRAIRTIEPENIPLEILYEDEHFVVVNKQANLIVHPARSNVSGTLINGLAWHFRRQIEAAGGRWSDWKTRGFRKSEKTTAIGNGSGDADDEAIDLTDAMEGDGAVEGLSNVGAADFRPGIIHRLDRFTTGVIVVGKRDEAHWQIARQFETRQVLKAYLAVCHNAPDPPDSPGGAIDQPIGKHPTVKEAMAIRRDSYSKDSVTLYRVRERYKGYSLVELELKTGRTHQIRVHLSYLGCPIAGDLLYGGEAVGLSEIEHPPIAAGARRLVNYARPKAEGQRLERQAEQREDMLLCRPALHAALLRFTHPIRNEVMTFTAPLHEPMLTVVQKLREHPARGPVAKAGYWIDLEKAVGLGGARSEK